VSCLFFCKWCCQLFFSVKIGTGRPEAFFVGDEMCVKEISQKIRGVCIKVRVLRCHFF
jgi:hypothetical protein